MVLNCILWYCFGIAWYCMVLHGIARCCIVLYGIALYRIKFYGIAWYCIVPLLASARGLYLARHLPTLFSSQFLQFFMIINKLSVSSSYVYSQVSIPVYSLTFIELLLLSPSVRPVSSSIQVLVLVSV